MRLTNAIALAVRNIAVIRISVFILDFSFPGFSVRVERICLHSFQKKNAAEIAKEVWTTEENPSCQRSSTTERGVKVTPTFSTTDWVRRGCRQKRTAKTSRDSPIRLAAPSLEKSRLMVYGTLVCQVSSYRPAIGSSDFLNETHRKHGSPIQVPRTQSPFQPLPQRNAFRRRGVHQQSRSCAEPGTILTRRFEEVASLRLTRGSSWIWRSR